jgi:hypothetical protein
MRIIGDKFLSQFRKIKIVPEVPEEPNHKFPDQKVFAKPLKKIQRNLDEVSELLEPNWRRSASEQNATEHLYRPVEIDLKKREERIKNAQRLAILHHQVAKKFGHRPLPSDVVYERGDFLGQRGANTKQIDVPDYMRKKHLTTSIQSFL